MTTTKDAVLRLAQAAVEAAQRSPRATVAEIARAATEAMADRPTPTEAAPEEAGRLYPFDEGDTDGIVIRCADPRFRRAFDAFVTDLGIRHPATIAVTGSIKSFALQAYIPKEWHALRKQLELIATRHAHVTRVVLLTHDDCQSYKASAHLMGGLGGLLAKQRDHLKALARFLREKYLPGATFELYHARLVEGDAGQSVAFDRIG
jgi:hypothetical protein